MGDLHVLTFTTLSSGYVHIRGQGPCNWAQPPRWPCSEDELESAFFGEAGERFKEQVRAALSSVAAPKRPTPEEET